MGFNLFACFGCGAEIHSHSNDEIIKETSSASTVEVVHLDATTVTEQIPSAPEPPIVATPPRTLETVKSDVEGLSFVFSDTGMTAGIVNSSRKYSADRPVKLSKIPYEQRLEEAILEEQRAMEAKKLAASQRNPQ